MPEPIDRRSARPGLAVTPSQEQRRAARHAMLAMAARRQRPGAGSVLRELRRQGSQTMQWWQSAVALLQERGIEVGVAGAVAANAYMPPRYTADLDLALRLADLAAATNVLRGAGWALIGQLELYEGLEGSAWRTPEGSELDLIGLPGAWGDQAIAAAQRNVVADLPTLPLEDIVVAKLISARPQDTADISRMLGGSDVEHLEPVRAAVRRWRPADLEDLEQMIVAGRLEYGGP